MSGGCWAAYQTGHAAPIELVDINGRGVAAPGTGAGLILGIEIVVGTVVVAPRAGICNAGCMDRRIFTD